MDIGQAYRFLFIDCMSSFPFPLEIAHWNGCLSDALITGRTRSPQFFVVVVFVFCGTGD
jgi:hypothetical protein